MLSMTFRMHVLYFGCKPDILSASLAFWVQVLYFGCKSCPVGDKSCPVGDESCRRVKVGHARNTPISF